MEPEPPPALNDKLTPPPRDREDGIVGSPNVAESLPMTNVRRYALLLLFCGAQFMDAFNNTSLFTAIPSIVTALRLDEAESVWLISSFALTFASFLLLSGRLSDVYDPKPQFVGGIASLGVLSLICGFMNSSIPLLILRALMGCAAALTIPSALSMIVSLFPDPQEQSRGLGAFGACGALGNISGFLLGSVFVEYTSWRWVFWFVACVALPIGVAAWVLAPPSVRQDAKASLTTKEKIKNLDLPGVSILTIALILLVFAVTSGTTAGWSSAQVLAPLIISVFMIAGFFYYETTIPIEIASVPPRTWFYPNFGILFFVSLEIYFWFGTTTNLLISHWQINLGWSAISTSVHLLPVGLMPLLISFTTGWFKHIDAKWSILVGNLFAVVGTVLFQYGGDTEAYWRFIFPGLIIGCAGVMVVYVQTNVAIFRATPPEVAGTVGAIFNAGVQLGTAVGYAAVGSVAAAVDKQTRGGGDGFRGRKDAFRVLLAFVCLEILAVAWFMRTEKHIARTEENMNNVPDEPLKEDFIRDI